MYIQGTYRYIKGNYKICTGVLTNIESHTRYLKRYIEGTYRYIKGSYWDT